MITRPPPSSYYIPDIGLGASFRNGGGGCGESDGVSQRGKRGGQRKELVYVFFFHPVTHLPSLDLPHRRVKLNTIAVVEQNVVVTIYISPP